MSDGVASGQIRVPTVLRIVPGRYTLGLHRNPSRQLLRSIPGSTVSARTTVYFDGKHLVLASNFVLFIHSDAARSTARRCAERTDIDMELSQGSDETVSMHAQDAGRLGLIPISIPKDGQDKLLFEFFQRFGVGVAGSFLPQHQSLQWPFGA